MLFMGFIFQLTRTTEQTRVEVVEMRLPRQNRLPAATWMLRRCYLQGDQQAHLTSMAPALNPEQRSQHRNHPPLPPLVEV
ncbi:hypothetical protein pipiens_015009 [Culex pipiens pipiens]|uniref:Uncharacterized protein n=1 Tax=Culex pipiens pipiens TaxID=38569 RepID=A0ABD1CS90_CULPP